MPKMTFLKGVVGRRNLKEKNKHFWFQMAAIVESTKIRDEIQGHI